MYTIYLQLRLSQGEYSLKRYKVISFDFDGRAQILNQEISDDWDESVKLNWQENKRKIKEELISELGSFNCFKKIKNFSELGSSQPSIIAFHNEFLQQANYAYSFDAYYPALTAASALGERVLNHLILKLRDYFKNTSEYRKIYRKKSFDNWDLAINTLEAWDVLLPEVVTQFRELKEIRNGSIHFNPETDNNYKDSALEAILILKSIIKNQFSGFGNQPWYISGTLGSCFVRSSHENEPFVKEIILPNCVLVGHLHTVESKQNTWQIVDEHIYADIEVSDERFRELVNNPGKYGADNTLISTSYVSN